MDEIFDLDQPLKMSAGELELELDASDASSLRSELAEERFRRGEDISYQLHKPFCIDALDDPFWEKIGKRIKEDVVKVAIAAADPVQPRWRHVRGELYELTEYGRQFFARFQKIIDDRFSAAREAHRTGKPLAIDSMMAPRDDGAPPGIDPHPKFDPSKSVPPPIPPHEALNGIRATCQVCVATHGHAPPPHDCRQYQIGESSDVD